MTATMTRSDRRSDTRATVRTITYRRPWLYEKQRAFLFTECRYSVVEATTKSGKTHGCLVWLNEKACLEGAPGREFWWVAPVYGQAKIAYRRLKRFATKGFLKFNDGDLSAVYPNGAVVRFRSAEKPDNLYGDDVYAAVLDEASRMREEAWVAIRSTLTATRGHLRIIGNVKGRKNWYYKLARKAQAGEPGWFYAKITAWDAVEAGVLDRAEVEDAQRVLPVDAFNELYLAEPTEDGSNPFGIPAIRACLMDKAIRWNADPEGGFTTGRPVAARGVDLAKSIDWTVDLGLDDARAMCRFDRWQAPWKVTTPKLHKRLSNTPTLIDATGVGNPVVETLQDGRAAREAFVFTSSSKQLLMEGLALAIQSQDVSIWSGPNDVVLNELEAFEYVYTPSGGVKYSAPKGMHDDCVVALALAVEKHRRRGKLPRRGATHATL